MLVCAMLLVLVIDGPLFVYAVIKPSLHTYILPTYFLSFFVSMSVLQTTHHSTVSPHNYLIYMCVACLARLL